MKKLVKISIQQEMLIDIPDHLTTEEFLKGFSETMWEVKDLNELLGGCI